MLRGGGWGIDAFVCGSAYRLHKEGALRSDGIGFRIVATVDAVKRSNGRGKSMDPQPYASGNELAKDGSKVSPPLRKTENSTNSAIEQNSERPKNQVALDSRRNETGRTPTNPIAPRFPDFLERATLRSRVVFRSLSKLTTVALSRDGTNALVGGLDGLAQLWDLKNHVKRQTFQGHEGTVRTVAISYDGKTVATGGEDRTVRIWDAVTGKQLHSFVGDGVFSSVQFLPEDKFVCATNWDRKFRIWNLLQTVPPREIEFESSTLDVAPLPIADHFAISTGSGQVLVFALRPDGIDIKKKLEGPSRWVNRIAIVESGTRILSTSQDRTIRFWNLDSEIPPSTFVGHTGIVHDFEPLPDGKRLVSCGADGTIRLWNQESGKELAFGIPWYELRGLCVAPDGKSCLSVGVDGALLEWELPPWDASASPSVEPDVAERRVPNKAEAPGTKEADTIGVGASAILAENCPKLESWYPNSAFTLLRTRRFDENQPFNKLNESYIEQGVFGIRSDGGFWAWNFDSLAKNQMIRAKIRVRNHLTGAVGLCLTSKDDKRGAMIFIGGDQQVRVAPSFFAKEQPELLGRLHSIKGLAQSFDDWNELACIHKEDSLVVFVNGIHVDTIDLANHDIGLTTLSFAVSAQAKDTVVEMDEYSIFDLK